MIRQFSRDDVLLRFSSDSKHVMYGMYDIRDRGERHYDITQR